ncbi:helix-turn-helix transcriptional regulator [Promicromonospora sp. NPDC023805]|uniref:helix-turn-helix domain-containing protein n=1 Tax=Promicromonospora sp. NPDC023805 TaxID=3154696 RepID=UPI0034041B5E
MGTDGSGPGDVLRAARVAAGWSLSRMERATGYSKPYLSKLETGAKEVKPWHAQAYDKALGGDSVQRRSMLRMGSGVVSSEVWAELESPTPTPARIGGADVVALAETVDQLTGLGLKHGGQMVVAAARGQLQYAASLLGGTMTDVVRGELLLTVAHLADRTAWSMYDVGQVSQAARIYEFAMTVAPDDTQRCISLVNLAQMRITEHDPAAALKLLDEAEPDRKVMRFRVNSTRALAHATLGEYTATMRNVDAADAAHAGVDLGDLPTVIRPYASGHDAHAHAAAGKALHILAMQGRRSAASHAVERLTEAVSAFGNERARAIQTCQRRLADLYG